MITTGEAFIVPAGLVTYPVMVAAHRGEVVIVCTATVGVGHTVVDIAVD